MSNRVEIAASAAARAETFLELQLKDQPRLAAEVLTQGKLAGLSPRTIQRASIALGVTKRRKAFRGGWIWSLATDIAAKVPSASGDSAREGAVTNGALAEGAKQRAQVIAARLQRLEATRGYKAPIYPQDPRVIAWAASGISDPDLREAYERAAYDLAKAEHAGPITAGILNRYVREVISEGAKELRGI